jgi:ribose 5-phosphate isomerase B
MPKTTVLIAADHRGIKLKARLTAWLSAHGYAPKDLGTQSEARCDAFDYAKKLAEELKADADQFGILICGTGHAMAMTANRYRDVRAVLCLNADLARLGREHNDANVLVLAADFTDETTAEACVETFLKTQFLGGRYAERRDKLTALGGLNS